MLWVNYIDFNSIAEGRGELLLWVRYIGFTTDGGSLDGRTVLTLTSDSSSSLNKGAIGLLSRVPRW